MIKRKFIIFQENIQKPIEVTDISNDSDEHISNLIQKQFESNFITILQTDKDTIFMKPDKINAIIVSKIDESIVEEKQKQNKYSNELKIDDSDIENKDGK